LLRIISAAPVVPDTSSGPSEGPTPQGTAPASDNLAAIENIKHTSKRDLRLDCNDRDMRSKLDQPFRDFFDHPDPDAFGRFTQELWVAHITCPRA
jgi:hypothetical protein